MKRAALAAFALASAACTTSPAPAAGSLTACPAYKPAFETTDRFMAAFNARDSEAWAATLHFPHVRIASSKVTIINSARELDESFDRLEKTGWDHSAWAARTIVQCEQTKAHMLTSFVRYRKDGSVLSQFDSLYIIEFKDGKWAITARSSFAP